MLPELLKDIDKSSVNTSPHCRVCPAAWRQSLPLLKPAGCVALGMLQSGHHMDVTFLSLTSIRPSTGESVEGDVLAMLLVMKDQRAHLCSTCAGIVGLLA